MSKKRNTKAIDRPCIETMKAAALLHNPVAHLSDRIGDVLGAIAAMEIRRPNDWQFSYTGSCELRWYDGDGESLSGSTRNIGLTISDNSASFRGRLNKDKYAGEGGFTIGDMPHVDAVTILKVFVDMIDAPRDIALS